MKSSKNPMRPWTFRLAGRSWGPTAEGVMDLPTLQQIVDVLNGDKHPDATELLQSLVQRWKDAAWDVDKVCDSDPLVGKCFRSFGRSVTCRVRMAVRVSWLCYRAHYHEYLLQTRD